METHLLKNISESQCQIINITAENNDTYWEKENEIFIMNGEIYDIAKIKIMNGQTYAYCITEQKESEMLDDITLKFTNAGEGGKDCKLTFSQDHIFIPDEYNKVPTTYKIAYTIFNSSTVKQYKNIFLPPPRNLHSIA